MAEIKSQAEFEATGLELHDALLSGVKAIDPDGYLSVFRFDDNTESVTQEIPEMPGYYEGISIGDFVAIYAPPLKQAAGEDLGEWFESELAVLAASIHHHRRRGLARRALETAIDSMDNASRTDVPNDGKYPGLSTRAIRAELNARRAYKGFSELYRELSEVAGVPAVREVPA